jgi:hypothetical protein
MSITNTFGLDAWNAYNTNLNLPGQYEVIATNFVSIVLNNNSLSTPGGFATNISLTTNVVNNVWRGLNKGNPQTTTNGMLAFLMQTNLVSLPPSYFSESLGRFVPVQSASNDFGLNISTFLPGDLQQQYPWSLYNWTLGVTNYVMYALVDRTSGQVFDFVNLGPFGTNFVLTNLMASQQIFIPLPTTTMTDSDFWDTAPGGNGLPSVGVLNQISNGAAFDATFKSELLGSNISGIANSNLYFSCSNYMTPTFPPQATNYPQVLLVNDPLVHYTVGDLTRPKGDTNQILTENNRYEAWPGNNTTAQQQTIGANMTFKDPQIQSSDYWNFPANKFPSIGWLGRVHRGTPWQTIFLKADGSPLPNGNPYNWTNVWVSTFDTYPTNDYALLDLFTAAPNDNAVRGLLSVNQTNNAPWYAVLAGTIMNTNSTSLATAGPNMALDPVNIAPLLDGPGGINPTRVLEPDQLFHSTGSIFKSAALTISSPFLPGAAGGGYSDEQVEAIPQQVAGLLKLGQPQFVIYGFGQALKPKDIYFGGDRNFNLVTNYQITGEYVTRTVCHVVGDPAAANVKIQVDSFNILPAD